MKPYASLQKRISGRVLKKYWKFIATGMWWKNFENLKNELDFKRLHTHNQDTTQGKIFVSFISLIVKSYILNRTAETVQMTQKQLFLDLDKIKVLKLNEKTKLRLINPLTKSQRSILEALNIPQDTIIVEDNLWRI